MDARGYVSWFHSKFKSSYSLSYFPTLIEDHTVLISMVEKYNVKTVCEIGTWRGDTALLLWLHPNIMMVKAIDICKEMDVKYEHHAHGLSEKDKYGIMFRETPVALCFADTMKYPRGCEHHDMVFIDGNHDYDHVKNDTELAISWNPKVIVWHDYGGGNDDVVKYINEIIGYGSIIGGFPGSLCVVAEPKDIKLCKGEKE